MSTQMKHMKQARIPFESKREHRFWEPLDENIVQAIADEAFVSACTLHLVLSP
jgi:hypothetical protein